jgi:hypothetical protein
MNKVFTNLTRYADLIDNHDCECRDRYASMFCEEIGIAEIHLGSGTANKPSKLSASKSTDDENCHGNHFWLEQCSLALPFAEGRHGARHM